MRSVLLLCFINLLLAATANAQFVPVDRKWNNTGTFVPAKGLQQDTGKLYLRFSPMGLIDFADGNINVGAEYRLHPMWSVTLDAGAIFYSQYFPKSKRSTGMLLRPGIRLYPGKYRDYFVDLQLHYKRVDYHVKDWLQRELVNGVASYEELTTFRYRKEVMGVHVMGGFKQHLSRNRRWYAEVYLGVGVHFKNEFLYDEPRSRYRSDVSMSPFSNTNNQAGDPNAQQSTRVVVPALPAGVRISYKLF